MKGIVFTEFLEMVEGCFSPAIADQIIEKSSLATGGAYTAVGTYDHMELVQLVSALSNITGRPVPDLVQTFGKYLFGRFVIGYPAFFSDVDSSFAFLQNIETYIHPEVRKLYSDAELPHFECEPHESDGLTMTYQSSRPFGDLAEGLIRGCAEHFHERIDIRRENVSHGTPVVIRFTLTKAPCDG